MISMYIYTCLPHHKKQSKFIRQNFCQNPDNIQCRPIDRVGGDEGKSEALRKLIGQAANSLGKNSPTDGFLFQHSRLRHRLQNAVETLLHNKLMT